MKHISRKLLNENRDKEDQDTITLHFDSNEELRENNKIEILETWLKICKSHIGLICHGEDILDENKKLKSRLLEQPENKTTLDSKEITEIQCFSDEYNRLLDNEYKYIKEVFFQNLWKRGIAIYTYLDSQLEYSLFSIKKGELFAPIIQLPKCSIFEITHKHDYVSFSCSDNKIKENPQLHSLFIIKKHIDELIKKQKIIPLDDEFLKEYVHDFIADNNRHLHLKKDSELNIIALIQHFQFKYPYIDRMPVSSISGKKSIYINTVYEAINCLSKLGYITIPYPYPPKGSYGNTGMIYDFFSPSTALEKSKIVILSTIRAYQNFIQSKFPLIANELDAFYGGNLISVLVDYSDPAHKFIFHVYYFRSKVPSNEKIITIEDIDNSIIMQENNITSSSDFIMKESIIFNGKEFTLFRSGGLNDMTILFGKYNCLTFFYELLKNHFDEYFKKLGF